MSQAIESVTGARRIVQRSRIVPDFDRTVGIVQQLCDLIGEVPRLTEILAGGHGIAPIEPPMGEAKRHFAHHLLNPEITQDRRYDAQLFHTDRIDPRLSELTVAFRESFARFVVESAPVSQ